MSNQSFIWNGQHEFWIHGTDLHEDTLWIENNYRNQGIEPPLRLTLPTLCITYADMQFANAVGGRQANYPASKSYGAAYFDPPVEINGKDEVEKFTWIRGAHFVSIGPRVTHIEWYVTESLVVPRLRMGTAGPVTAELAVSNMPIDVNKPLQIEVSQYADGRATGGLRIEKRHPNWVPVPEADLYDLSVHVIDGTTQEPMPEVILNVLRWDSGLTTPHGTGGMKLMEQRYTDSDGAVYSSLRPSGELEALNLQLPGWRALARCFRALPGQEVNLYLRAWPLKKDIVRYTWSANDSLGDMASLTGYAPKDILDANGLNDATALNAGVRIDLPCYAATYRIEQGDSFEWLADAFGYLGVEELAKLNGVGNPSYLDAGRDVQLPGWHFLYARPGDSLERIDEMFGLPLGSSRLVGRVHHPDARLPYASETIAIPTTDFLRSRPKKEAARIFTA